MLFQDNVLKAYLRNVYFIAGTPCGGKTTVSRALSEKFGIPVYDNDYHFDLHRQLADREHQPSMLWRHRGADDFFGRTVEEYRSWLQRNAREQLDFVLLDLIRLSQDGPILCDSILTLEQAGQLTDPSRIAFLIKDPTNLVDDYCNRPDHRDFSDFIHSAADYEKAKAVCNETLRTLNAQFYVDVRKSDYFWLDRAQGKSVDEAVSLVEKHFGWDILPRLEIRRVEKDTPLAAELLRFVETCSWAEVREHIAGLIRDWTFTDWETMFAAVLDGQVVGMASLLKNDYYPLPEICPWVSCLFVTEEFRGRRIPEKLIAGANAYAKGLGFSRTYIPSDFAGFYERFGYRYVKDIVNYGGGTDHLFVKEL